MVRSPRAADASFAFKTAKMVKIHAQLRNTRKTRNFEVTERHNPTRSSDGEHIGVTSASTRVQEHVSYRFGTLASVLSGGADSSCSSSGTLVGNGGTSLSAIAASMAASASRSATCCGV